MDIIKIKEIIDLITNLKRENETSFLISTHMLDKLEVVADRVGFLYNGSIGYELDGYDLIDEKRDYVKIVCDDVSKAAFVIEGKLEIKGYKVINNNVIRLYDLKEDYNKVIFELIKSGVFVESFNRNKRKLQNFLWILYRGAIFMIKYIRIELGKIKKKKYTYIMLAIVLVITILGIYFYHSINESNKALGISVNPFSYDGVQE